MPKPALLRSQGQRLAELIEQAGFDKSEFELTATEWDYAYNSHTGMDYTTDEASRFTLRGTDFYFMLVEVPLEERGYINGGAEFIAQWSPNSDTRVKREGELPWLGITARFTDWLDAVKNELTGPDVWAELAGASVDAIERGAERFNAAELLQIDQRLDQLLDYARRYELTAESTVRIEEDVRYLKDAARRMPRLDWRNAALGTAMGWLVSGVVPPETFSHLFRQVVQIVQAATAAIHLLAP
jgi:hypothetical protein